MSTYPFDLSRSSRISAYQNTASLHLVPKSSPAAASSPALHQNASSSSQAKSHAKESASAPKEPKRKPVPLPRSKIPVAQASAEAPVAPSAPKASLHARFFGKRSKTDLGSDGLAAYKAKKPGGIKYPAPKVPTFNRPIPQKRQDVPAVKKEPPVVQKKKQEESSDEGDLSVVSSGLFLRPEVKEKPHLFTTFKQSQGSKRNSGERASQRLESRSPTRRQRLSKVASESDLMQTLAQEAERERESREERSHANMANTGVSIPERELQIVEPVSINISDSETTPGAASEDSSAANAKRSSYYVAEELLRQNSEEDSDGTNKLIIDTSKNFKGPAVARSVSNDSLLSEPAAFQAKSEPLQITTEPLNDLRAPVSASEVEATPDSLDEDLSGSGANKSSCSTSFESTAETDDSLLSSNHHSRRNPHPSGGSEENADPALLMLTSDTSVVSADLNGTLRTKSPSTSTTSRSPPSPEPMGLTPVRQVRRRGRGNTIQSFNTMGLTTGHEL